MGLNGTPASERVHIGFFGLRNAGKSSLVNRIAGQEVSLVSDVKGTTTDPVKKAMELLPLGPVVLIDTPGFDDEGALGAERVRRTRQTLAACDVAVLVTENESLAPVERELRDLIAARRIPCLTVFHKADRPGVTPPDGTLAVSAATGQGVEALKEALAHVLSGREKTVRLAADLIAPGQTAVLVVPVDASAPKGRLILPQQQTLRDILDAGGMAVVTRPEELPAALDGLRRPPALVITDSQAFGKVMRLVPETVPLTSFSILMARYKGFLAAAVEGAAALDALPDGARVLISEGCTHHRQCEDIGTVKLPGWLREYTGKRLALEFTSGHGFPDDPAGYDLIIHCGGCMLGDAEMQNRMRAAAAAGVPFTNYGTVIAHIHGILARSLAPLQGKY